MQNRVLFGLGMLIVSPSLYCSLEDMHKTLETLNDTFYKIKKSQNPFFYDLTNTKSHNEFKELLEEITAAINKPETSVRELPSMNKYTENMQTYLDTIKTKTDALEAFQKSYQKESRLDTMNQRIAMPAEIHGTDRSKNSLRTQGKQLIEELTAIIETNDQLLQEINGKEENTLASYDTQIYSLCSRFIEVLNSYISTVIKQAKHDLRI